MLAGGSPNGRSANRNAWLALSSRTPYSNSVLRPSESVSRPTTTDRSVSGVVQSTSIGARHISPAPVSS